jgi:formate hydrogenlyase subunit 4
MAIPVRTGIMITDMGINTAGIFAISVLVGIIESSMARLKLLHIPQMLLAAFSVTVAAFLWLLR